MLVVIVGVHCETDVDDCASQPCENGGQCVDQVNAYLCDCPQQWMGQTCNQVSTLTPLGLHMAIL